MIPADILKYNDEHAGQAGTVEVLAAAITKGLPIATSKVWHGAPVWFLEGNPIVGYTVRKSGKVSLMFWSGQSFEEPALTAEGRFKAAEIFYEQVEDINTTPLAGWLNKAKVIQWDYKNIVKNRGKLKRL